MSSSTISLRTDATLAFLTLDRPDAGNAMNRDFWAALPERIAQIRAHPDLRAVILASSGRHFSAGMDLSIFAAPDPRIVSGEESRRSEYILRLVEHLQSLFTALEELRMPVLAAVQGACVGAALDLVCCADMRYCTRDAFFQIKETQLGMTADLGTLQRLPRLIPEGLARELAYTGRKLDADAALRCGLVNAVFDTHEQMLVAVTGIAREIATQSPLAVHGSKRMIGYARDHDLQDSLHMMACWQAGMFRVEDMGRAMRAAATGTPPAYDPLLPADSCGL